MITELLRRRGFDDERVLSAMERVPRDRFVPEPLREHAFEDRALALSHGQTISQPYIVALMTQQAQIEPDGRVLDIGTGSGYQAAVLAEMGAEVFSVEIVEELARSARARLDQLNYQRIRIRIGDGSLGWPKHAPFDAIVAAAAPESIPKPLLEQLALGARLVIPVGPASQQRLVVVQRMGPSTFRQTEVSPVAFVPMTGQAQQDPQESPTVDESDPPR